MGVGHYGECAYFLYYCAHVIARVSWRLQTDEKSAVGCRRSISILYDYRRSSWKTGSYDGKYNFRFKK